MYWPNSPQINSLEFLPGSLDGGSFLFAGNNFSGAKPVLQSDLSLSPVPPLPLLSFSLYGPFLLLHLNLHQPLSFQTSRASDHFSYRYSNASHIQDLIFILLKLLKESLAQVPGRLQEPSQTTLTKITVVLTPHLLLLSLKSVVLGFQWGEGS